MLGFQEQGFLSTVDCSLHVPAEYLHMAWMNVMPSRLRVLFNRRVIVASVVRLVLCPREFPDLLLFLMYTKEHDSHFTLYTIPVT